MKIQDRDEEVWVRWHAPSLADGCLECCHATDAELLPPGWRWARAVVRLEDRGNGRTKGRRVGVLLVAQRRHPQAPALDTGSLAMKIRSLAKD